MISARFGSKKPVLWTSTSYIVVCVSFLRNPWDQSIQLAMSACSLLLFVACNWPQLALGALHSEDVSLQQIRKWSSCSSAGISWTVAWKAWNFRRQKHSPLTARSIHFHLKLLGHLLVSRHGKSWSTWQVSLMGMAVCWCHRIPVDLAFQSTRASTLQRYSFVFVRHLVEAFLFRTTAAALVKLSWSGECTVLIQGGQLAWWPLYRAWSMLSSKLLQQTFQICTVTLFEPDWKCWRIQITFQCSFLVLGHMLPVFSMLMDAFQLEEISVWG